MKKSSVSSISINLLLINAFIYISASLYTPFLSSYFAKSGINAVNIGILSTIGPVTAILIQPLWAVLSDRTGRRKDVLSLVVLGSALSMFGYYIGHSFLTFFIATLLLTIFSTSIVPLSDAIIIRSAAKHQLDFSKIRMGGTTGYAIVVIFAGAIVKQQPSLQFVLGAIGYTILFIIVRKLPKEESDVVKIMDKKPVLKSKSKEHLGIFSIFESKQIIFILAFALISQIGLSFNFSFLGVYMTDLGLSEGMIGIINSIAAFSELPILFLINRVMRKVSAMKIIIFSCLLVSLRIFTITGGNVYIIILSQALHGITFMSIYYSCAVFISQNVKPENQSQGQSALSITQMGIGSIVGNILGGYLVDTFGLNSSYRIMTAIILTCTVAFAIIQFTYQKKLKLNVIKEI